MSVFFAKYKIAPELIFRTKQASKCSMSTVFPLDCCFFLPSTVPSSVCSEGYVTSGFLSLWFSFLCVSLPFSILQIVPHHLILPKLSPHHLPFLTKTNSVTLCRGLLRFLLVGPLPWPGPFSLSFPPPHSSRCTHRRLEHSLSLQVRFQCLLPYMVALGKSLVSLLLQLHPVCRKQVTPVLLSEC